MHAQLKAVAAGVAALLLAERAEAFDSDCAQITRNNLVQCALRTSLRTKAEESSIAAARAREVAAGPILPRNPELEVLVARRRNPEGDLGLHWSAKLSQEVELGGQRGLRRHEAAALLLAQRARSGAVEREVAISAWDAYFEIAAAERQRLLAARLETIARQVRDTAKAMARAGVLPPVDADLAEMSWARSRQGLIAAENQVERGRRRLGMMLGAEPTRAGPSVAAELKPIAGVDAGARRVLASRGRESPEVRALEAEGRALQSRARLLRRTRVPNLTFSVFAERNVFEGQLLGGSISLPLPLPHPLGRTASGEIAEALALAARAATEAERSRRETRAAVTQALAAYESRLAELDQLGAEQSSLAERDLDGLVSEVRAGRIAVRDALVAEQQLIDFLRARAEAEHALCLASVALAEAANLALPGESP